MRVSRRLLLVVASTFAVLAIGWFALVWIQWRAIPTTNTAETRFDTILVLGSPCRRDGSPSTTQRVRVAAAVEQWRAGVAPRMILSGGAAHNRWVEADCMAKLAEAAGVPEQEIFEERQAQDTIQNVYYADAIMQAHGWHSADVVSSWFHLPRAGLILARFPIRWRTVPAPWPKGTGLFRRAGRDWAEAFYCFRLRVHGFPRSGFLPNAAAASGTPGR